MKKYENLILIGAFLLIVSTFLPWHSVLTYQYFGGVLTTNRVGSIPGHNYVGGWAVLAGGLLITVLTFLPKRSEVEKRLLLARGFLGALALVLLLIAVFNTANQLLSPHLGLLVLFAGVVFTALGVKLGMSEA